VTPTAQFRQAVRDKVKDELDQLINDWPNVNPKK
jgi:hypothetical protein